WWRTGGQCQITGVRHGGDPANTAADSDFLVAHDGPPAIGTVLRRPAAIYTL
ncbi:hypothetical protein A2U01_0047526, partial [Trifolium medium]|nr:hypothetical protein [Trifolium medium]